MGLCYELGKQGITESIGPKRDLGASNADDGSAHIGPVFSEASSIKL